MERWANIEGWPGYQVSTEGRVMGLKGKCLKASPSNWGYPRVTLHIPGGSRWSVFVHRLVAMAFIPNPNSLPEVNHLDGDKLNPKLSNLEWVTHQGNMAHAWATGLSTRKRWGEAVNTAVLTEAQVIDLRTRPDTRAAIYDLLQLGFRRPAIGRALTGETWGYLDARYPPVKHRVYVTKNYRRND